MAVDLFALRMNIETTGLGAAQVGLSQLDATGRQTAASVHGMTGRIADLNMATAQAHANSRALAAQKVALGGTLNRISRDVQAASTDFKAGRISTGDYAAAMAFARGEATKLGSAATMSAPQLKAYNGILAATAVQTTAAAKGTGFLKDMMSSGMVQFFGVTAVMGLVRSAFSASFEASDRFTNSQTMLAGIARITGVSLRTLQAVSSSITQDFKLTTFQANELTAGMNKLTQAAGQPEKMRAGVEALLDIGAARGLSTVEVLRAINNALAGNDEGTDKLFMKNPSEIYRKWAVAAGTTHDKMDSVQRAQALLDALLTDGAKVRGEYAKWLETTPGKQQQMATATEQLAIAFGRLFNPMRDWVATGGAAVLNWMADVATRMKNLGWKPGAGIAGLLGMAIGGAGAPDQTDWDAGDTAFDGVQSGSSTTAAPRKALTAGERAAARAAAKAERERLLGVLDAVAPDTLPGGGGLSGGPIATRDDRLGLGPLVGGATGQGRRNSDGLGGSLSGDLFEIFRQGGGGGSAAGRMSILEAFKNEAERQAIGLKVQFAQLGTQLGMTLANGFATAIAAGIQGKNVFKAFGNVVLSGLGSIMQQMGQALIAYGITMLKLLPFLTNIFTSGPAAIAAGIALTALGATLGGVATGGGAGGGGGSASRDRVTQITLTADGAGGFTAPHGKTPQHFTVIGASDPRAPRIIGEINREASRRNMR